MNRVHKVYKRSGKGLNDCTVSLFLRRYLHEHMISNEELSSLCGIPAHTIACIICNSSTRAVTTPKVIQKVLKSLGFTNERMEAYLMGEDI